MGRIDILAGGREERGIDDLARRYLARLPWPAALTLIPEPRGGDAAARQAFLRRMQRHLSGPATLVALDERGRQWASRAFAERFEGWLSRGRPLAFVIGGADGLPPDVLAAAHERWSLSRLTFPHNLVRLIVAEQLYRAASILKGHPYHREGPR